MYRACLWLEEQVRAQRTISKSWWPRRFSRSSRNSSENDHDHLKVLEVDKVDTRGIDKYKVDLKKKFVISDFERTVSKESGACVDSRGVYNSCHYNNYVVTFDDKTDGKYKVVGGTWAEVSRREVGSSRVCTSGRGTEGGAEPVGGAAARRRCRTSGGAAVQGGPGGTVQCGGRATGHGPRGDSWGLNRTF